MVIPVPFAVPALIFCIFIACCAVLRGLGLEG